MAAAFCFALARPVAWADHFGIAMPIFAVLLIAHERRGGLSAGSAAVSGGIASLAIRIMSRSHGI